MSDRIRESVAEKVDAAFAEIGQKQEAFRNEHGHYFVGVATSDSPVDPADASHDLDRRLPSQPNRARRCASYVEFWKGTPRAIRDIPAQVRINTHETASGESWSVGASIATPDGEWEYVRHQRERVGSWMKLYRSIEE